jgi:hypothetical protein
MIERPGEISPANVGLTIEESKTILESLQHEVVTAQVQQHGVNIPTFDLARVVEARFARRATTVPHSVLFTERLACVSGG